ncbi:hypothetical protein ACOMHN_060659 [Nucella lapillus]
MAGNNHFRFILPILFMLFVACNGEWCTTTTYCQYGCCGTYPYETCCADTTWLIYIIAGSVSGGIFFIVVLVVLICVCVKKQSYKGRVVRPTPTVNPTVQSTMTFSNSSGQSGAYASGMQPPYGYPPPPPGYIEPVKY